MLAILTLYLSHDCLQRVLDTDYNPERNNTGYCSYVNTRAGTRVLSSESKATPKIGPVKVSWARTRSKCVLDTWRTRDGNFEILVRHVA
ncbi:hypothetical protein E4U54_003072 [Claviceps lovelessii]|nr:hypothetical protein E4U54_003072 [Claviceps lovelessii]